MINSAHPEDGSRDSGPFGLRTHKISRSPIWPTRCHHWQHSMALVIASHVVPPSQRQKGSSPLKHGFPIFTKLTKHRQLFNSAKLSQVQDRPKCSKRFKKEPDRIFLGVAKAQAVCSTAQWLCPVNSWTCKNSQLESLTEGTLQAILKNCPRFKRCYHKCSKCGLHTCL